VNRAGRAQAFVPARGPGLSVIQLIDHEDFPRAYRPAAPESDARQAWWVLEQIRERVQAKPGARTLEQIRGTLAHTTAGWAPMNGLEAGSEGAVLDAGALRAGGASGAAVPAFARASQGLAIYHIDRTLGSESLSRRSKPMREAAGAPHVRLSSADASRLGTNGRVQIQSGGANVVLDAETVGMADGVLIVPRDAAWPSRPAQGAAANVTAAATEEVKA